jgi:hypothetical protein
MKFLKIFSFLLSLMLLSCSSSSSDGDGEVMISCSPTRIDVPAKGGTYKIMIVASEGGWEARASFPGEGPTANVYPWFKVSASGNNKAMGMVTVDVEENKSSVALGMMSLIKALN